MKKAKVLGALSPKWDVSFQLFSELGEPSTRGGIMNVRVRRDRDQGNKTNKINLIRARMNSQRVRQHERGLHISVPGPLCTYYGFQISIFMEILSGWASGSLFLVPSMDPFSFCLFVLSNSGVFILSYDNVVFIFYFYWSEHFWIQLNTNVNTYSI